jgi:signal transduction histidine kinase
METLIDDLLTLSRAGATIGETEAVDLADLIERCWQNVESDSAELIIEADTTIKADRSRLQQLLENLMRNAVEHGDDDVTVTVGTLSNGFYIEDDGPGIPEDNREDVFKPGYSTAEDGTGFGLSIVKQVAEAHGWNVGVTEGTDDGARFEITGIELAAE